MSTTSQSFHNTVFFGQSQIDLGDSALASARWPTPDLIISDGPYGLGQYPGEPATPKHLAPWYEPHVAEWSKRSRPGATLWFWNTEVGWATVHPVLEAHGWEYQQCGIWDKGIAHVAGHCNSKTIRAMPVVTEVAARYTKRVTFKGPDGVARPAQDWLRNEWMRSGLPMIKANEACGVKNAAARKYLTSDHHWYLPPGEAMMKMAAYCENFGRPNDGWPYFSMNGAQPISAKDWDALRPTWHHAHGHTNVWHCGAVHGHERLRSANGYAHPNQKPLEILDFQIKSSSNHGDVIWEPFGGVCSAAVAALRNDRLFFSAEIFPDYFNAATARLQSEFDAKLVAHQLKGLDNNS